MTVNYLIGTLGVYITNVLSHSAKFSNNILFSIKRVCGCRLCQMYVNNLNPKDHE